MKKTIFHIVAGIVWLAFAGIIYASWTVLVDSAASFDKNNATPIVAISVTLLAFLGVVIHSKLADAFDPKRIHDTVPRTAEAKRQAAELAGADALKEGRPVEAMDIFEKAGLYLQAAQVAQQVNDKVALLRFSVKLGHYDRARRICVELEDYEGAAHAATLMGDITAARDYFRQAAVLAEESRNPKVLACWTGPASGARRPRPTRRPRRWTAPRSVSTFWATAPTRGAARTMPKHSAPSSRGAAW